MMQAQKPPSICNCHLCIRSRKYKKFIKTITNLEAKQFFEEIYNVLYDVEEENDYLNMYQRNLKTIYPKIYSEMHTLKKLEPGGEKFPEVNI